MNPSICIDKLQLVTRMEKDKIKFILRMGGFNSGTKEFYNVYRSSDPHYEININPTSISAYKNYNVMILFNPAKMNIVPANLVNFIGMSHAWRMSRVDIAFDFQTPINRSFYKPFQNTKINKKNDNDNCYYGTNRSKCLILHYDKNKEQQDKGFIMPSSALTRFEFRLNEDLNKQPRLHDLNFEWIKSHLDKGLFIPDYTLLPSPRAIEMIRSINERERDYSGLTKREKAFLNKIATEHRTTFFDQFKQRAEELFYFIKQTKSNQFSS